MKKINISVIQILSLLSLSLTFTAVFAGEGELKGNPRVAVIDYDWVIAGDSLVVQNGELIDRHVPLGGGVSLAHMKAPTLEMTPILRLQAHRKIKRAEYYYRNGEGCLESGIPRKKENRGTLLYIKVPDGGERLAGYITKNGDIGQLDSTEVNAHIIQDALGNELSGVRLPTHVSAILTLPVCLLTLEGLEITDEGIADELNKKANFTAVIIKNCPQVTDTGIGFIAEKCPRLNKLFLDGCPKVTNAGIGSVGVNCPNLIELHISGCSGIRNRGFVPIGENCLYLKKLFLSDCGIRDDGINAIATGCKSLRELSLIRCNEISDVGMGAIAKGCPQICRLSLDNCEKITDVGMLHITCECPNLTNISLSNSNSIGGISISQISVKCEKLTKLSINACAGIEDKHIKNITERCKNLTELSLIALDKITDAGVKRALKKCKGHIPRSLSQRQLLDGKTSKASRIKIVPIGLDGHYFTHRGVIDAKKPKRINDVGKQHRALTTLRLDQCPKVAKNTIAVIFKLKKLRNLNLNGLKDTSKVDLLPLLRLSNLETLVSFNGQEFRGRTSIEEYLSSK